MQATKFEVTYDPVVKRHRLLVWCGQSEPSRWTLRPDKSGQSDYWTLIATAAELVLAEMDRLFPA